MPETATTRRSLAQFKHLNGKASPFRTEDGKAATKNHESQNQYYPTHERHGCKGENR